MATVASPEPVLERPAPDYVFEPELMLPTPRRVPKAFRRGGRWARRREIVIGLLLWAAVLLFFHQIPLLHDASHYIVPLQYAEWIGLALLLLACGIWVSTYWLGVVVRMYRLGTPIAVRVVEIGQTISEVNGNKFMKLIVDGSYLHPSTGELLRQQFSTEELGAGFGSLECYSLAVQPGQTVTALMRDRKSSPSLLLYGLMGVNPLVDYLLVNGKPVDAQAMRLQVRASFLVASAIILILLLVPSSQAHWPLSLGPTFWLSLAVLGCTLAVTAYRLLGSKIEKSPRSRVTTGILIVFFGIMLAAALIPLINAAGVRGRPEYQQFIAHSLTQTTHGHLVRSYSFTGVNLTAGGPNRHALTFDQVQAAAVLDAGVLDIRKGLLGLPYIRKVEPLMCNVELDKAPTTDVLMTSGTTPGGRRFYVTVVPQNIDVNAGPMQPALVDHVRTKLIEDNGMYEVMNYATELERETAEEAPDAAQ